MHLACLWPALCTPPLHRCIVQRGKTTPTLQGKMNTNSASDTWTMGIPLYIVYFFNYYRYRKIPGDRCIETGEDLSTPRTALCPIQIARGTVSFSPRLIQPGNSVTFTLRQTEVYHYGNQIACLTYGTHAMCRGVGSLQFTDGTLTILLLLLKSQVLT